MQTLLELAVLFIMIWGVCYMFGRNVADGFVRRTNRLAQNGVRHVGRSAGRAANAFPLAAGIFVIILVIMAADKC